MFKFKVGQMVRIVPGASAKSTKEYGNLAGKIGIIKAYVVGRTITGRSLPYYRLEGIGPSVQETLLVKIDDKPDLTTWDEFERLTGTNPSKELATC